MPFGRVNPIGWEQDEEPLPGVGLIEIKCTAGSLENIDIVIRNLGFALQNCFDWPILPAEDLQPYNSVTAEPGTNDFRLVTGNDAVIGNRASYDCTCTCTYTDYYAVAGSCTWEDLGVLINPYIVANNRIWSCSWHRTALVHGATIKDYKCKAREPILTMVGR